MSACFQKLLNQDASSASATNKKSQKNSALHYAAEQNFGNIVKLLLEAGVYISGFVMNAVFLLISKQNCSVVLNYVRCFSTSHRSCIAYSSLHN